MAKTKRYLVTLNPAQKEALEALMQDGFYNSPSAYIVSLIVDAYRNRGKKGPTRARNAPPIDNDEEEIRDIPHPDQIFNAGKLMTATEYESYCALKGLDPATGRPLKA